MSKSELNNNSWASLAQKPGPTAKPLTNESTYSIPSIKVSNVSSVESSNPSFAQVGVTYAQPQLPENVIVDKETIKSNDLDVSPITEKLNQTDLNQASEPLGSFNGLFASNRTNVDVAVNRLRINNRTACIWFDVVCPVDVEVLIALHSRVTRIWKAVKVFSSSSLSMFNSCRLISSNV